MVLPLPLPLGLALALGLLCSALLGLLILDKTQERSSGVLGNRSSGVLATF